MDETRPPIPAEPWYVTPALARTLDALARLAHTGAFIGVVKGPTGAGKSLLLERLGALLAGDEHLAVARLDTGITPGLLGSLAGAFGLAIDGNPTQTRRALIRHLTELHGAGRCPVALIDDAQRLSSLDLSLLIRLGLSADKGKSGLLNVILAGTGELDQRIAAAGEDLSRQRVYVAALAPLTVDESLDFLARHADPLPARLQGTAGRRAVARTGGQPGALLALLHERRRPMHGLPVALASAAVLVAAVGAVLYQNYPEPTPEPVAPAVARPIALAPAGGPSSPAPAPAPGLATPTPAAPARVSTAGEPATAPAATTGPASAPPANPPLGGRTDAPGLPADGAAPSSGIVSTGLASTPAQAATAAASAAAGIDASTPAAASAAPHATAADDSGQPPTVAHTDPVPTLPATATTQQGAAAGAPPAAGLAVTPTDRPPTEPPAAADSATGQTDSTPFAPATGDRDSQESAAPPTAAGPGTEPEPKPEPGLVAVDPAAPPTPASPPAATPASAAAEPAGLSSAADDNRTAARDTDVTGTPAPAADAPAPSSVPRSDTVTRAADGPGVHDDAPHDAATAAAAAALVPPASGAVTATDTAVTEAPPATGLVPPPAPAARIATTAPARTPAPKPPVAPPARGRAAPIDDPLARAPQTAWVVQLAATESEARLRAYAARNGLGDIAIVRTRRDGRDWFVLLLGGYHASRDAAEAALARLPGSLRVETVPWVRSVRSLRKLAPPRA